MKPCSLLELNQHISRQMKDVLPDTYWVVAEINELHVNSSGHCFMELVEKAPQTGQITAKARANIWAYSFRMISPYFESTTGCRLAAGMKVMLQASVEFHELFGMSLQVTDINPAFTMGDLAIQRQAVIEQLVNEGVFDMNRELTLSDVPQRIAVISSATAAGYGDFVNQLQHNSNGFAFQHTLFQATMQGNDAEASIVRALEQIFDLEETFDAVVLIRGGGAQSDLNCFNSYWLASCLAQFPLPVITGIGHDRDETIADLVACVSLKTPTAVAEFLIGKATTVNCLLQELFRRLTDATADTIGESAGKLQQLSQRLQTIMYSHDRVYDREIHLLQLRLMKAIQVLLLQMGWVQQQLEARLQVAIAKFLQQQQIMITTINTQFLQRAESAVLLEKKQTAHLEEKLHLLDPVHLLRRGYSITFANGKTVRSAQTLGKGQLIKTILFDGEIDSIVN
jgi:exodeoxyribonuclease VII large subunit